MIDFLPSQVVIKVPPLAGTMGRSEREYAAALIVRTCEANGDTWQGVSWKMLQEVIKKDVIDKRSPFCEMMGNPFLRPDVQDLAACGFATLVDGVATLTEKGFVALAPWVRRAEAGKTASLAAENSDEGSPAR